MYPFAWKTIVLSEFHETYRYLASLYAETQLGDFCSNNWISCKLIAYPILDTRDVEDEDTRVPVVKAWVLGHCGGSDVCLTCQRIERVRGVYRIVREVLALGSRKN
jgi:hypothetical protein